MENGERAPGSMSADDQPRVSPETGSAGASGAEIPLMPVAAASAAHAAAARYDAPYRLFLVTSLALALFGGFLLAVLLPLAQTLDWSWGLRWQALVQAHGQLQLLGFAGLFVMGMSLRLMPRFSGIELPSASLVRALIPLIATSVILRSVAQPWASGALRDAALIASAALLVAGALAFATLIWGTVLRRNSRAEATGWYFSLGALAYVAQSLLNAAIVIEIVRRDLEVAPLAKDEALVFLQLFGFILLFLAGVSTRAVPALTGHPRPDAPSRVTALVFASAVAVYTAAALWAAYETPSVATARVEDTALIVIAAAFVAITWLSGVFRPRANRVAAASQFSFFFVRAAFAWMIIAAALITWYALGALPDGRVLDSFETDAVRHALTLGVVTMMIIGVALLVVPEFAGRRLQHPGERLIGYAMLIGLNATVVLRVWPATEGLDWLGTTRFWPMAVAGLIAIGVVAAFTFMFVQSYIEQRPKGWASPQALKARTRPDGRSE